LRTMDLCLQPAPWETLLPRTRIGLHSDGHQQIPATDRDMHQQHDHDDHHAAQRRRVAIPQVDSQPEAEDIGHRRPDGACHRVGWNHGRGRVSGGGSCR